MKEFKGYDEAKKQAQYAGAPKLPEGAYICKILGVRYEEAEKDDQSDRIIVQFDICEGEYKGYYKRQYEANTSEDKKWKGVFRLYVPKDDGSEQDGWAKKRLASWTLALEESNEGYEWDWDEDKWKNKLIGIVFGKTGTVIEGKNVTFTEPRFPVSIEKVKNGTAPQAQFKARDGYKASAAPKVDADGFMNIPDDAEEEIPF